MSDITILSPHRLENSVLQWIKIPICDLQNDSDGNVRDAPKYSTIQSFKGLDSQVVILVDSDDIRKEHYQRMMYIATTRARALLYVLKKNSYHSRLSR